MVAAVSRAEIVAEARRWIGTPFLHQASLRGAGTDCVGLVRGVWRAVIGGEPEAPPPYPHRVDLLPASILLEFAGRHLVPAEDPQPGDVLAFRLRAAAPAHHAAILTAPGRIVHAWGGHTIRMVVETAIPPRADLVAAFSFPGVVT